MEKFPFSQSWEWKVNGLYGKQEEVDDLTDFKLYKSICLYTPFWAPVA